MMAPGYHRSLIVSLIDAAEKLRSERESWNMSRNVLAERAGVSLQFVQRLETADPGSSEQFIRVCRVCAELEIDPAELAAEIERAE